MANNDELNDFLKDLFNMDVTDDTEAIHEEETTEEDDIDMDDLLDNLEGTFYYIHFEWNSQNVDSIYSSFNGVYYKMNYFVGFLL